jgi:hypothetical protein
MSEKKDPNELREIKELLLSHMLHLDAVTRLLVEREIFSKEEFFVKLKQVNQEYQMKSKNF